MIDKPLYIIIFIYLINIFLYSGQFMLASEYGLVLTNHDGQPITPELVQIMDIDSLNDNTQSMLNAVQTSDGTAQDINLTVSDAVFELVALASGTYIFYLLILFGLPAYLVGGIIAVYGILIIRMVAGLLRGLS